ncbi:hypothetical protein IW152_003190 [Coemansia sp. BCRC 34962]|nr:hypothetical protein IW152_003190 [Coemansia sp. BCRC 34962]
MATVRAFSASILRHTKVEHAETCFKPVFVNGNWRSPGFIAPPKVMQKKPPRGHKQQRQYADKQAIIAKNMKDMPDKIRKWKEALAKERLKAKPILPF